MKTHSTRHRYKANPKAIRNLKLLLHFSAHWSRDSLLGWMIPPRQVDHPHPTHSPLPGVPLLSSSSGWWPLRSLEGLLPLHATQSRCRTVSLLWNINISWSWYFLDQPRNPGPCFWCPFSWPFLWSFCLRVLPVLWIAQWKSPNNEGLKP